MSHDSNRTRIWFPMFSYFESSVDGIIPNEYDSIDMVCESLCCWIIYAKDCCMLTARRFWIAHNQFSPLPKTLQNSTSDNSAFFSQNLNNLIANNTTGKPKLIKESGTSNLVLTATNEIGREDNITKSNVDSSSSSNSSSSGSTKNLQQDDEKQNVNIKKEN